MAKILIVDDRPLNRELLATILNSTNHQLLEASDGQEALEIAKNEHPDVIITDIMMPRVDGYELVYQLRKDPLLKKTKVIFYTAQYLESEAIDLAKAYGVMDYIIKPAEPEQILKLVNNILNQVINIDIGEDIELLSKKYEKLLSQKLYQKVDELTMISQRIQELKEINQDLEDISVRDSLTGLFNRRYLPELLSRWISRAKRKNEQIVVFMIDLDYFKEINDQFGHKMGDKVLQIIARCLIENARQEDVVCRYGGEEFTVLLFDTSPEIAFERAEKLRIAVETLSTKYKKYVPKKITISIGISSFPKNGQTVNTLIKAADAALYLAKRQGRNKVVISA